MPTAIENARKRLAEIRAEAEEIERFIAMYARFEGEIDLHPKPQSHPVNYQEPEPVDNGDNPPEEGRNRLSPRELATAMKRIIGEAGRPMTRGKIVETLELCGIEIPAKDKSRYIGTIAWRNDKIFANVPGRGYWLNDRLDELTPTLRDLYSKSAQGIIGPETQDVAELFT